MSKAVNLYIWEKQVKWIKKNVVTFMDGSIETYTEKQLSYMITKEPQDLTQSRDLLLKMIVPEVMDVLEKHNIRKWDLDAILHMVIASYNNTWDIAIGKAFWTYKEWTSPEYFQEDIKVSDLKRLIGK